MALVTLQTIFQDALPAYEQIPVKPGKWVPMKRSSRARRLRAVEDALNMAW